jgi:hypothetical protein
MCIKKQKVSETVSISIFRCGEDFVIEHSTVPVSPPHIKTDSGSEILFLANIDDE